jgi:long-chain fatty acid transport protein
MKLIYRPIASLALGLLAYNSADASATRIAFIDSFATARGNAFTATADKPSAVFYNAAGLTQLEGTQIQGNVFSISLGYEYDGANDRNSSMDDDYQAIPNGFISHKFKDSPIAIGFGMYAPFALSSDWGKDSSFTQATSQSTEQEAYSTPYEAELSYIKYHAVVAWQVTENFSIAAGLSFDESEVDIKATALEFDGSDQALGYSLSALWQPNQRHSFGLNYQAKTEVSYEGNMDILTQYGFINYRAEADLSMPESIVFGYSYRPNEKWNLEFNMDWTNWDRVNELTIKWDLPVNASYKLNWESAFIWELGLTRYFDNGWHLSAGYTFVENAVPDDYLLPIVPDADRHFLAIGLGGDWERINWQITYQQAFASERSVSGNKTSSTINGDYDLDSQAIAISLNFAF